jgi:2-desacetyl-2-hydroxyethyl bacteriochlorophyllide A dehydrogenase
MKAVKLKGIKTLRVADLLAPRSVNGSVIADVKKAGICGSDIHNWDLGMPEELVLGHEFCGVVTDIGDRNDLKVGDRITALPLSPCGDCPACKTGNYHYCPHTWENAIGLSLSNPGAYAEKVSIRPDLVVKVPSNITDAEVAMIEPTAVALHAVNLADVKIGDNVLIIGAGVIGDLCAMFAKMNGASYVAISETNTKRGQKAVSLKCADDFFDVKDDTFMENVKKNCPFGYDIVIDCSGNSAAVTTAITTVKPNGTVVLVGVSITNISIPSALIVTKELKLFGAIAYTMEEFEKCINLMSERKIDVLRFVDDIVGFDDVQKSFERLTSGNDNAIKILIDPNK